MSDQHGNHRETTPPTCSNVNPLAPSDGAATARCEELQASACIVVADCTHRVWETVVPFGSGMMCLVTTTGAPRPPPPFIKHRAEKHCMTKNITLHPCSWTKKKTLRCVIRNTFPVDVGKKESVVPRLVFRRTPTKWRPSYSCRFLHAPDAHSSRCGCDSLRASSRSQVPLHQPRVRKSRDDGYHRQRRQRAHVSR